MNKLFGPVLHMAYRAFVQPSVRRAKIRAVFYYIDAIRTAREATIVLGVFILCVTLVAGGAILVPVALCLFMPWQPQTKALVACAFGVAYLVAPLLVAIALMSEKRWMRMTRADDLMKDVLSK